jgi:DNA-binding LacI/PurR family transcriptional regulator
MAAELGYDPAFHQAARRLASRRQGREPLNQAVSLVIPSTAHKVAYFSKLNRGIMDVLCEHNIALVTTWSHSTIPLTLRRGEVDGMLTFGASFTPQELQNLRTCPGFGSRPIVTIGYASESSSAILFNYAMGARAVVEHLLALGHRHLILPNDTIVTTDEWLQRLTAIRTTLHEHGLDPDRHLHVVPSDFRSLSPFTTQRLIETGEPIDAAEFALRRQFVSYLRTHPEVTAVFAVNDAMARYHWHILTQAGFRGPDQLSIVGFDDTDPVLDAEGRNLLTSVRLPLVDIGRQAATVLLQRIRGELAEDQQITFPTELVPRASTAAPDRR